MNMQKMLCLVMFAFILFNCSLFYPERTIEDSISFEPKSEILYSDEVIQLSSKVINETLIKSTEVAPDLWVLEFNSSSENAKGIDDKDISDIISTPGQFVILEATDLLPTGLLGRVDTISINEALNTIISIHTRPIDDVLNEILHISFQKRFMKLSENKEIHLSDTLEYSETTKSGTVRVSIGYSLTISDALIRFYYDRRTETLFASLSFYQEGSISLTIDGTLSKSKTWWLDIIPPIPLEEVGIPAHIEIEPFVSASVDASGYLNYQISEYSTFEFKISRANGKWIDDESLFTGFPLNVTGNDPLNTYIPILAKASAGVQITLKILHLAGPFFGIEPYIVSNTQLTYNDLNKRCTETLSYGLDIFWGVEAEILPRLLNVSARKEWRKDLVPASPIYQVVTDFEAPPLPLSGLIARYSFSGNASDSVASNDGTLVGGPSFATDRHGIAGGAIQFNGLNQFVQLPNEAYFDLTDLTIYIVIEIPNHSPVDQCIITKAGSGFGNYCMEIQDGTTNWGNSGKAGYAHNLPDGNWCLLVSPSAIPTNTFVHLAITLSESTAATYYNGIVAYSCTNPPVPLQNNANVTIGTGATSESYFHGLVDEVLIYNRSLSSTEISQLYDALK